MIFFANVVSFETVQIRHTPLGSSEVQPATFSGVRLTAPLLRLACPLLSRGGRIVLIWKKEKKRARRQAWGLGRSPRSHPLSTVITSEDKQTPARKKSR
jgi:hypothetical protein